MAENVMTDMKRCEGSAVVSDDGKYRYTLERTWDDKKSRVFFVMLNPSTADDREDDPTVRRCIGFAKSWGFGGLAIGNLFAYRATDPAELLRPDINAVGPYNDDWLRTLYNSCGHTIIAAWGNHGALFGRGREVATTFPNSLECLGVNKSGQPSHPLYLPKNRRPVYYNPEDLK